MAVREVERKLDAHLGAEIVTLENSFGAQHVLTINLLAPAGKCPACGYAAPRDAAGAVDVDTVVAEAKAQLEQVEAQLAAHAARRGFSAPEELAPMRPAAPEGSKRQRRPPPKA